MSAHNQSTSPCFELSRLVAQIRDLSESTRTDPAAVADDRSDDGAWTYQFTTADQWGIVAAGPHVAVETTYPGWGPVRVEPGEWTVFVDGDLAGIGSPARVRIGSVATIARDEHVTELETALVTAIRAEREALASATDNWECERPTIS